MPDMEHDAVKQLISEAIAPLEVQIGELRAELEALKNTLGVPAPDSSLADAIESAEAVGAEETLPLDSEARSEIPAERTDFMRFIQRGLEQEEKEYKDEPAAKPEKKTGWNPFKR